MDREPPGTFPRGVFYVPKKLGVDTTVTVHYVYPCGPEGATTQKGLTMPKITKTQIRKELAEMRSMLQQIEKLLKADEWQDAYVATQELSATATELEYTFADHTEVTR